MFLNDLGEIKHVATTDWVFEAHNKWVNLFHTVDIPGRELYSCDWSTSGHLGTDSLHVWYDATHD